MQVYDLIVTIIFVSIGLVPDNDLTPCSKKFKYNVVLFSTLTLGLCVQDLSLLRPLHPIASG